MALSSFSQAAPLPPDRLNEDSFYAAIVGDISWLMVADGAGQRLLTTKTAALFAGQSAARYAAAIMRETMTSAQESDSPRDLLLRANQRLADTWSSVYGDLTAAALIKQEAQLKAELEEDERRIRLALAVCVATVARIDLKHKKLDFAHAGDTALLIFQRDGRVISLAQDQMGPHDADALRLAQAIQRREKAAHLSDVLDDARVQAINRGNGLYHNYVDENGDTDPSLGVGVIDGLPQLEAYLQTGTADLSDVGGLLLGSDGFMWPAPLDENEEAREARYRQMRTLIEQEGLEGYVRALRAAEQADSTRDLSPRFKIHDDATAVYMEL